MKTCASISGKAMALAACGLMGLLLAGCATLKPYEKEHLLDPTMADDVPAALQPGLMSSAAGRFEKLGQSGGAASGSSCPTCGG